MPIVHIHMLKGRSVEQKRAMVDGITKVICDTAKCPADAVKIVISDMEFENFAHAGVLQVDKK